MPAGANKRSQEGPQDRADTFKANPMRHARPSKFQGKAGTPDPNGDGSRPKGRA